MSVSGGGIDMDLHSRVQRGTSQVLRGGLGRLSISFWFQKLASGFGEDTDGHGDTIVTIAEVIKQIDLSLRYLEV